MVRGYVNSEKNNIFILDGFYQKRLYAVII
jgi:hypothetical protein